MHFALRFGQPFFAVDLIAAAKADDKGKLGEADRRWKENADQIADFLSSANPNWPRATMREMMQMHLSTTTDEVKARLARSGTKTYAHTMPCTPTS